MACKFVPKNYDDAAKTITGTTVVSVSNNGWATSCPLIKINTPSASGAITDNVFGYSMNFANVNTESTEIPITWAFRFWYDEILSLTEHSSFVQIPVNAWGKKSIKIFSLPIKSDKFTFALSEENKLKSGACLPFNIVWIFCSAK